MIKIVTLSYSSLLKLVEKYYSYDIGIESVGRSVLFSISPNSDHKKFTSQYLSHLWNADRNIKKSYQSNVNVKKYKIELRKQTDYFYDDLKKGRFLDFKDDVKSLILKDPTIKESQKNHFLELMQNDEEEFLFQIIRYAISRPNKNSITKVNPADVELFDEVSQQCPLCNNNDKLVTFIDGHKEYRFTIVKIFPDNLPEDKEKEFTALHSKPSNLNDITNKICLCDSCASEYLYDPTVEVYDKLFKIKQLLLKNKMIIDKSNSHDLEEQIMFILDKINEVEDDNNLLVTLSKKPLKLANKIRDEYKIMRRSISSEVHGYYYFIKDYLATLDGVSSSFDDIAKSIRSTFEDLNTTTTNQSEIFNALVDWIINQLHISNSYKDACHIVVSFFVQNCEVFNEITE